MRMLTYIAIALLALASASCAKILGIEDTELLELPANLACVGSNTPPMGDGSPTDIVARIVDLGTGEPVEGLHVRRCATRLDAVCAGEVYTSDADGLVEVPVNTPFNGYLRIEDPLGDGEANYVTYFWYFSQPIVGPREEPFPISAMTRATRNFLLYNGTTTDPTLRGEIAINSTDCADENASGITFEITTPASADADTHAFYQSDVQILIDPANAQTDGAGLGGFLGVKPGSVGIRALHAASGTVVAEDTLLVRPDVLTTVRLLPQ